MASQDEIQAIETLQDLGITRKQAVKALARYGYDVGRAADYIFSGLADNDSDSDSGPPSPAMVPSPSLSLTQVEQPAQPATSQEQRLVKDFDRKIGTDNTPSYDLSKWSVVPASSSKLSNNTPSLTWWIDSEDPSDRLATTNIPVGLRPPGYNFAFAPVVILSLFHITTFQHRVLSYRPTAIAWGSPQNYWKGSGEAVSGNIQPTGDSEQTEPLPRDVKCVAELQKLFAFLEHSERQYGNVDPVVQTVNSKTANTNTWSSQDVSADEFIDMLISTLLEADNHRDLDQAKEDFRSLFSLRARVEYIQETDTEEIFYLALGFNEQTLSFHECLGPLVFESGRAEDASDIESMSSGEVSVDDKAYKITTFERVPPILVVTLEDKTLKNRGNSISTFHVDRTLYMDRYLYENREKVLESYSQAQAWKEEVNKANAQMTKLRNNNLTDEQGKIVTIDKREILTKTMDYFEGHAGEAIESVQAVLNEVRDAITTRIEELEELVKQRTNQLHNLFNGPEYRKAPYDVRAILHHDGMSGTGHYWGYIWVEPGEENLLQSIPNDEGGWFRFCDASVRPSNEDEVFGETTNPFAVIYADRNIPSYSKAVMTSVMPCGLQNFVHQDNMELEEEIRVFNSNDRIIEERIDSPPLTASENGNSVFEDDAGSIGTAVGENASEKALAMRQRQQEDLAADNASFVLAHNRSLQSLSSSLEEDTQRPTSYQASVSSSTDSTLQEKLNNYIHVLLVSTEGYTGDDYRLIKSFEFFLGKLRDVFVLKHFIYMYTESFENDKTVIREEDSRNDPQLEPLWREFDSYVGIARVVTRGLNEFAKGRYLDALLYFIQAQQEEAMWKTHLLVETEIFTQVPNIQGLGFAQVILRFGKRCIKILNDYAHSKATEAAYRTRGLQDAINIARYAQTIIGPERLSTDSLFNEMRETWLKFSELQGGSLEGSQAELLNTLIMAYLEAESTLSSEGGLLPAANADDDDDWEPVWQKYKKATQAATERLNSL